MSGRDAHLLVCTGSHCRRDAGHDKLLRLAAACPGSSTVGCQDICRGPIAAIETADGVRWYRTLRGRRRRALRRALRTGRRPKELRRVEVRNRRGVVRNAKRRRALS